MGRKFDRGYSFRSSDFHSQPDHWQDGGRDEETGDPCACGDRCAARDYEGNAKRSPRAFCDVDDARIGDAIREMPETYAELRLMLVPSGQQEERVSGSREAPVNLNLDVQAFMREIVLVMVSWEEQVQAVARLSGYPDGPRRDSVALADACRTLNTHKITLLSLPREEKTRYVPPKKITEREMEGAEIFYDTSGDAWESVKLGGVDAGLEILDLSARAWSKRGLSRPRRRITEVPCDGCNGKTLVQYGAKSGGWEPVARCTDCRYSYIGTQFELLIGRVYSVQVNALRHAS